MTGLVDYQTGAVVSRMLMDKNSGTVTLFSFDAGQGLSEHTAPYDALVLILEGQADITISGKTLIARQGDMVIMPAHQPHALRAPKQFKMALVMLRSAT
ncbi:MAG TPA: cupin domain-containing protein [Dehalococcoidia bacterium]|nr:cupin domain-containing protein [Dehalococcoidia bacterium]